MLIDENIRYISLISDAVMPYERGRSLVDAHEELSRILANITQDENK